MATSLSMTWEPLFTGCFAVTAFMATYFAAQEARRCFSPRMVFALVLLGILDAYLVFFGVDCVVDWGEWWTRPARTANAKWIVASLTLRRSVTRE